MALDASSSTNAERALVVASICIFLFLACYRIDAIGAYYDEWIFVPVALKTLGACDLDAAVGKAWDCLPLMQAPPYVGVVKAWLMAPVFALFGVNEFSVRLPPILVAATTLLLIFRFSRERWGAPVALGLLAMLATDAAMIAQARFDWGPFVISNLCKVLMFVGAVQWTARGSRGALVIACTAACVGFWDKLSFVWLIAATFGALCAAYTGDLVRRLRDTDRGDRIILTITTLVLLFIVVKLVVPAMRLQLAGFEEPETLAARALRIATLYNHTFSGAAVHNWLFRHEIAPGLWPFRLLVAQLLVTPPLLWFARNHASDSARKLSLFFAATLVLLIAQMLATRQVGGAHHLIMFWPFQWLHLISLIALFARLPAVMSIRPAAPTLLGAALAIPVLMNIGVHRAYVEAVAVPGNTRPYFDHSLADLADRIDGLAGDTVISADWGLHQGLLSLARPGKRPRYRDWTWIVGAAPDADPARTAWLHDTFVRDRSIVLVEYDPASEVHRPNRIADYLAHWNACVLARISVPDAAGRPLYQVTQARVGTDTCED